MSDLLELAARCEAAMGPDRELDGEIDRLLHQRPKDGDYDAAERAIWRIKDAWSGLLVRGDGFARDSFCASEYTASIDAAMTLADPRALWAVGSMEDGPFARLCWPQPNGGFVGGYFTTEAATTPLALVAACLRARAAQGIDARQGHDPKGHGAQHESPVAKPCAHPSCEGPSS